MVSVVASFNTAVQCSSKFLRTSTVHEQIISIQIFMTNMVDSRGGEILTSDYECVLPLASYGVEFGMPVLTEPLGSQLFFR